MFSTFILFVLVFAANASDICKDKKPCGDNPCFTYDIGQQQVFICDCNNGQPLIYNQGCNTNQTIIQPICNSTCLNGGICVLNPNQKSICSCPSYYTGAYCETPVELPDPCAVNPCLNGGKCSYKTGNNTICITCECKEGYAGARCENRIKDICTESKPCGDFPCISSSANYSYFLCDCGNNTLSVNEPCPAKPTVCPLECKNGGTCVDYGFNIYLCKCPIGYTGSLCQTQSVVTHPCDSSPCKNGATCVNSGLIYYCECKQGFTGYNCENETIVIDNCPCLLDGKCETDSQNNTKCVCSPDTTGPLCEIYIDKFCNKCKNGGTCYMNILNNTNPDFELKEECWCPPYFIGESCETLICTDTCNNHGQCIAIQGTNESYCDCDKGWTGSKCDVEICYCKNNGTCLNGTTNQCNCPTQYTGQLCEIEVNLCSPNPCSNGGECQVEYLNENNKTITILTCKCKEGFIGAFCEINLNATNPCLIANPCLNGGSCSFLNFVPSCNCPYGFSGSLCEYQYDCYSTCLNGGKCVSNNGAYGCLCAPGYYGQFCENKLNFTNPCLNFNPCLNGGSCFFNETSNFTCECPNGYYGPFCEYAVPIDPCLINKLCQNNATCIFNDSQLTCICQTGFTGLYCENKIETPIKCSLACQNGGTCLLDQNNKPYCICSVGYQGFYCERKRTHFTMECPESAKICRSELTLANNSYCLLAMPCGDIATCIDLPFQTNISYVCLCKNNATMGFPNCNQNIKDLLPEKHEHDDHDDSDSSSSEEENFLKIFYLHLKWKGKGNHHKGKHPMKWNKHNNKHKRPCNLDNKVNLTTSYCKTRNPCSKNSDLSLCIDLPLSIRLKSNIPYMCLCDDTKSIGYPYCNQDLYEFLIETEESESSEASSSSSSSSEEHNESESDEKNKLQPKFLKKFLKKYL